MEKSPYDMHAEFELAYRAITNAHKTLADIVGPVGDGPGGNLAFTLYSLLEIVNRHVANAQVAAGYMERNGKV